MAWLFSLAMGYLQNRWFVFKKEYEKRKKSLLLVVLALVVLSALVIGCKNEASLPASVAFTSGPVTVDGNGKLEFKSDGTAIYFASDSGAWIGNVSCTVTYSESVTTVTPTGIAGSPISCYTNNAMTKGFASYKDLANASTFFALSLTFSKE